MEAVSPLIESSLVGASQIAALAEVGPSAVSNWRNRFDDFPKPVESVPGGRDLFRLKEVQAWLRERGKLRQEGGAKQLLFQAADLLRGELSTASMTETLGAAFGLAAALASRQELLLDRARDLSGTIAAVEAADPRLEDIFRPLLAVHRNSADRVLSLILEIPEQERPECFDWLLSRYNEQQGGLGHGSSEVQTALLSALTEGAEGVVYDPAAGSGGFLLAAARSMKGDFRIFGQEVHAATARIARQRFLVYGATVSMATGDTLCDDKWPDLGADVVICDPPYQAKRSWSAAAADDPRWIFGHPPKVADFAWLQHAVHHLAEGGRAYVFLPPGSLFRAGEERNLRNRLLAHGMVEAVVSLPAGSSPHTGIPLVLWILRRPRSASEQDAVLLVDPLAANAVSRAEFVADSIPYLASLLRGWRGKGTLSKQDESIAAAVSVEELLADDANLVPARWLNQDLPPQRREEQEKAAEQDLAVLRKRRRALCAKLDIEIPLEPPTAEWTTIGHLVRDGIVEIVTGSPVKADDFLSRGVRVFRPRDVSASGPAAGTAVYVSREAASRMRVTRAGDIVVSPVGGLARAFVDRQGGHVLARPVQALRLADGWMDPEVVAAYLESERNRRFVTGSSMPRVSLRDLEVPLLSADDAAALRCALEALGEQERAARELVSSAQGLRQTLVSLASPGEAGKEGGWRRSS
jgi:hypothetical protein